MKKTIGIIGGMGPLATADLFEKIISSMLHASAVTGRAGNHYKSLADLYKPGEK